MYKLEPGHFLGPPELNLLANGISRIGVKSGLDYTVGSGLGYSLSSGLVEFNYGEQLFYIPGITGSFTVADPNFDRKDLLYIDDTGAYQLLAGVPAAYPFPPIPTAPYVPLFVVTIEAGATSYLATDVMDLRLVTKNNIGKDPNMWVGEAPPLHSPTQMWVPFMRYNPGAVVRALTVWGDEIYAGSDGWGSWNDNFLTQNLRNQRMVAHAASTRQWASDSFAWLSRVVTTTDVPQVFAYFTGSGTGANFKRYADDTDTWLDTPYDISGITGTPVWADLVDDGKGTIYDVWLSIYLEGFVARKDIIGGGWAYDTAYQTYLGTGCVNYEKDGHAYLYCAESASTGGFNKRKVMDIGSVAPTTLATIPHPFVGGALALIAINSNYLLTIGGNGLAIYNVAKDKWIEWKQLDSVGISEAKLSRDYLGNIWAAADWQDSFTRWPVRKINIDIL